MIDIDRLKEQFISQVKPEFENPNASRDFDRW